MKEPKSYREASMNCKLRGGTLAMPKTSNTNHLMADYVSQAGLTRVYIGVQAQSKETVSFHLNIMQELGRQFFGPNLGENFTASLLL